jgi:hypothetical protein
MHAARMARRVVAPAVLGAIRSHIQRLFCWAITLGQYAARANMG